MLIDKPLNARLLLEDDATRERIDHIFEIIEELRRANGKHLNEEDAHSEDSAITVSINGAWGTGKSSYLKGLEARYKDKGCETLFFEAWRFNEEPDIFIALLTELNNLLANDSQAQKALRSLVKSLGVAALAGVDSMLKSHLKVGIEDIEKLFRIVEDRIPVETTRTRQNQKSLNNILEKFGGPEKPFVLLVDDLDRLVPERAYNLLERLRFYFRGPNVIIIMAINDEVINRFVHKHYEMDHLAQMSEAFLDKIFHYRFEIPYSFLTGLHLRSINEHLALKDNHKIRDEFEAFLHSLELRLSHRKWINVINRIEGHLDQGVNVEALKTLSLIALLKEIFQDFNHFYRRHEEALIDHDSPAFKELSKKIEENKNISGDEVELFNRLMNELNSIRSTSKETEL
ncbi:MAG: hypothetical protein GXO58_02995 [Thermodesulfobacteria bacterium]|nr:hypothetical protein [Thermodesulfobacteriota bacterium]